MNSIARCRQKITQYKKGMVTKMRTFTAPLHELGEFEEITKLLKKPQTAVALTGCVDSQKMHMIYGLSDGLKY